MLQHESPDQLTAWPVGNSLWPNQLSGLVCDPRVQGSNPSHVNSVTFGGSSEISGETSTKTLCRDTLARYGYRDPSTESYRDTSACLGL